MPRWTTPFPHGAANPAALVDRWWPHVLIVIAALTVYWPVLINATFPWDDRDYLAAASDPSDLLSSFVLGNYHPLTMLSLWVGEILGSGSLLVQHAINLALHTGTGLVLIGLVRRLTGDRWSAFAVALLFVIHPMHVESVAWIAERKNVLYAFFYLLALTRFIVWHDRPTWRGYAGFLLLALLAYCSKGQAVTLPLAALALVITKDGTFRIRKPLLHLLPLFALSLVFGLIAVKAQASGDYLHPERNTDILRTAITACYALASYVARLLLPVDLSIFYPLPGRFGPVHYASVACVLGAFAYLVHSARRGRTFLVGCALFFVLDLLPMLQWVPVGMAVTADRYAYVASVPFFLLVVHALRLAALRHRPLAPWIAAASLVAVLVMAFSAHRRAGLWHAGPALFERLAADHPESDIAQFNLATLYHDTRPADALTYYAATVEISPDYVQAWYGMGRLLRGMGRTDAAIAALDSGIVHALDHGNAYLFYYERAACWKEKQLLSAALTDLDQTLRLAPEHAPAHYLRGLCLGLMQRHTEAVVAYDLAERAGYDRVLVRLNKAISRGWLGDHAGAIADLGPVLQAKAPPAEAFLLMGLAKIRTGANGCPELQQAVQRKHPKALDAWSAYCGQ